MEDDTRRVGEALLGVSGGIDNGTRGTYYLDDFKSRQSSIGPLAGTPAVGEMDGSFFAKEVNH